MSHQPKLFQVFWKAVVIACFFLAGCVHSFPPLILLLICADTSPATSNPSYSRKAMPKSITLEMIAWSVCFKIITVFQLRFCYDSESEPFFISELGSFSGILHLTILKSLQLSLLCTYLVREKLLKIIQALTAFKKHHTYLIHFNAHV